ncbi:MAG: hypothetical protein E7580_03665 [Ruminococcaceae bacterium]|nr:hypothetical protein [Oscillospiraceae bacterium]
MKCGFFQKEITPPVGCYLSGNQNIRIAQGVADPLYVRAVAFEEKKLAVILCFDLIGMIQKEALKIRAYVAKRLGLEEKDVILTCTHTHTAPNIHSRFFPKEEYLMTSLKDLALSAAQGAIADLADAEAYFSRDELPGISFNRRYVMKDGSFKTNPGRRNPDILRPASPPDDTVQLLRFDRGEKGDILLVNFQVHPDVRGRKNGNLISADYPGVVCATLENALPGTHCIYFNGASGDLNHINVNAPEWDKNAGPSHSRHMGLSIAGKVLGMISKARPVSLGEVRTHQLDLAVPAREYTDEELRRAQQYMQWYLAGEAEKIPLDAGNYTTIIYEALGVLTAYESGGTFTMPLTGLSFGDVSFVGFPGEVFSEIGRRTRETSPFKVQFIMGLTHGYPDYFPTKDAYEVDGYERRSSPYKAGVGEIMTEGGRRFLKELFSQNEKE